MSRAQAPNLVTVFDASNILSHDWGLVVFGVLLTALFASIALDPQQPLKSPFAMPIRREFHWAFVAALIAWTCVAFSVTYLGWRKTAEELKQGQYKVVEGPVTDFQRVPLFAKGWEGFTVGGQRFWYSSYIVTPGFHQYAAFGGPIFAGRYVRVSYRKNLILKLEVAK